MRWKSDGKKIEVVKQVLEAPMRWERDRNLSAEAEAPLLLGGNRKLGSKLKRSESDELVAKLLKVYFIF